MVAILDPDAIPAVRLSVDEYLEAVLPEGYRYELVDGVVEMSPNPDGLHEQTVDALNRILSAYRTRYPDRIALLSFNSNLPIPEKDRVREPDVAVYPRW